MEFEEQPLCLHIYPTVHRIEFGGIVKWLRHSPFKATSRVRTPLPSLNRNVIQFDRMRGLGWCHDVTGSNPVIPIFVPVVFNG